MMGFGYVNGFPPNKGPLWPFVGIMAHLVVSDLLIYPFREILDPIKRGYPLYLLFVQPYILCSPNSKEQIKDVKLKDDPKVMAYPKIFGIKEKKFSHIRGLSLSLKVIS